MKKNLIIIIPFALLMIVLVTIVLLFLNQRNSNNSNPVSYTSFPTINNSTSSNFEVKELKDNEGMSGTLTNIQYSGVTGIEIYSNKHLVLSLRGIDGTGGNGYCSEGYQFSDTSADYIQILKTAAQYFNDSNFKIIDLTKVSYIDFNLYGRKARIANNNIFFNKLDNTSSNFNSECGLYSKYVHFPSLGFNVFAPSNNSHGSEDLYKVESHVDILNTEEIKQFVNFMKELNPISYGKL